MDAPLSFMLYLTRANPTERRGRKITSLRDISYDSGIAGFDAHLLARRSVPSASFAGVVVCPCFFSSRERIMTNTFHSFRKLISSLAIFGAFALAIAMTAYQIFSPDGHVFLWLRDLWNI